MTSVTATSFNPLAIARDLEAAGMDRRQAEAVAEGMRRAATADRADLATRGDLEPLATKAELATLRSEMRWMLGFLAALVLAIAGRLFGLV